MLQHFNDENNLSLTILQIRQGKLVFGKCIVIDQLVIKLGPESRHLYISPGF